MPGLEERVTILEGRAVSLEERADDIESIVLARLVRMFTGEGDLPDDDTQALVTSVPYVVRRTRDKMARQALSRMRRRVRSLGA